MKTHTNTFKTNLIMFGKQIDAKITYTLNNEQIVLTNEELNSIQPITQGDLLKSIMKELYIDSNVEIPINTEIQFEFGLFNYNNDEYEYVNFGKYYVTKSEYQEDTRSYLITCYDKMINSMVDYEEVAMIYPTTVRSYINELCETIGLDFANASDTFANYDKEVPTDLYKDLGYTYRGVLDELAQVTASNICINANNQLEIRYITDTNETFDEEYFSEDNVKFGKKIGKINSIVLSRSAETDNVYLRDEESVQQNGLYEIKIIDNQIMNFNNRSEFLPDILQRLDNLEFYSMDVKSTGICYLDICDRYTISVNNNSYTCVLMNDEININQGLEENIYVEEPKVSETEYKYADETDRKINQAYIIVNKQQGQIDAVVSQVETIEQDLSSPTNTLTGEYFDLEDALDSPLQDFSLYGDTQQDSTTGKNLSNINVIEDLTATGAAVHRTIVNDTIILSDNTNSIGYANSEKKLKEICPDLKVGDTAYLFFNTTSNMSNKNIVYISKIWTKGTSKVISQTMLDANLILYGGYNETATISNFMITKENDSTYEPYTAGVSPNPDYPQPIHNVSGDNTIEICGKNLFNKNNAQWDGDNASTYTIGSGNTNTTRIRTSSFRIQGNKTYTISGIPSGISLVAVRTFEIPSGESIGSASRNGNTFTLNANVNYIHLLFGGSNFDSSTNTLMANANIQLEEGNQSTEYEAYTGNSQLISLGVENLFDKESVTTGKYLTNENVETSATGWNISDYIKVNANEKYTYQGLTTAGSSPYSCYYDSSKNFVSSFKQAVGVNTITIPNGVSYVRFSLRNSAEYLDLATFMIEKGSKANSYSEYGKPYIELNKISTYQDYIYRQDNRWYLHKEIGKVVLDGTQEPSLLATLTTVSRYVFNNLINSIGKSQCISNYFTWRSSQAENGTFSNGDNEGIHIRDDGEGIGLKINTSTASTTTALKTWLSTHNTIVHYVLNTPTDTEITDTRLLEQLNRLMTLPLYKNMTHITLTPNDLQPTMKIEYYRDTSINENFVPKEDMTKYYTKTETNAQIKITGDSISSEVARVEEKTDANNKYTSRVETSVTNLQTDTKTLLTFKQNVEQNGVETLKNTLIQADINGLSITKGESFRSQITDRTLEVNSNNKELIFLGYDDNLKKTVARMDWIESEHATIGAHRTETITKNGKKRTAGFYVGGGN